MGWEGVIFMLLINLFLSFLRIGFFAIGGAYSFLPLIESEAVHKYHWLTNSEFLEILGSTQMFPGAISIKFATYTGYKIAGIPGAILANLGNILAPVIFIVAFTVFYRKFKDSPGIKGSFNMIKLVVFAMIMAVAFKTADIYKLAEVKSILVVVASFVLFMFTKIHPAFIIAAAGIFGFFWR